ncbi:alpha/beta hydrolase [bacterium]|nr:MAG: alpha/beta hydrolase [bacterium]
MSSAPHPPEHPLTLRGPAGTLQARLRLPPPGRQAVAGAVLFHPHPLFGGSLENKILYRIALRLAAEADHAVLRLNFRGAGESEGQYDDGRGEVDDALAGIEELAGRLPGLPLAAIGYSFGAAIGLRAGVADERVTRLVALGLPLGLEWDLSFLERTQKPVLCVQGEHDEFGDAVRLQAFVKSLTGPVQTAIIPAASHLFSGREDDAVEAVVRTFLPDAPKT